MLDLFAFQLSQWVSPCLGLLFFPVQYVRNKVEMDMKWNEKGDLFQVLGREPLYPFFSFSL